MILLRRFDVYKYEYESILSELQTVLGGQSGTREDMVKEVASLKSRLQVAVDALKLADSLESKMSDAWSGGIGQADLTDLSDLGNIIRRALSQIREPKP